MNYNLEYFLTKNWSFVLIKNGKIFFKSKAEHLKPLVFCVKKYKKEMRGAVAFDKVVGKAAAILLAHAKAKEVWTPTISRSGKAYLSKNKVKIVYKNTANCIMNRKGTDLCPMEKMIRKMPEKAFIAKMLE